MAEIDTILVVGGGVAGLTTAAALHRQGFTTELVERRHTWDALGAGFLVHANGIRMLLSLDLAAGVEKAGARLFADGNSATSRETCCRKPISRHCGAMQAPALGLNDPSCNARCC